MEAAQEVRERLAAYERGEVQAGAVTAELVDATVEAFAQSFDFRHGGFGLAPKFPNAGAMNLLLDRYLDTGTDWMRRIVAETLDAMARGGIRDQLGGGFHRYATDAKWRIPHFEKMAYDNGVLLETYAIAHAVLGDPLYRDAAEGILAYYRDVAPALVDAGGSPASQDADVGPHDDGGYWTWTVDEVRAALDGDEALTRAAVLRYGLDEQDSAMPHDRNRHVPYLARSVAEVARELGDDEASTATRLAGIRARLKAARDVRPRPFVDETVYSGWSALVASGHLAAARYLGRADAADAAVRALDRIWEEAADQGSGLVRHRVGDGGSGVYLEDQAYVAQALLDAHEVVQRPDLLGRARRVVDGMLDTFRDTERGALLDRPRGAPGVAPGLEAAHRPVIDSPAPGANAVAALTLLRLAALGGRPPVRRGGAGGARGIRGVGAAILHLRRHLRAGGGLDDRAGDHGGRRRRRRRPRRRGALPRRAAHPPPEDRDPPVRAGARPGRRAAAGAAGDARRIGAARLRVRRPDLCGARSEPRGPRRAAPGVPRMNGPAADQALSCQMA